MTAVLWWAVQDENRNRVRDLSMVDDALGERNRIVVGQPGGHRL